MENNPYQTPNSDLENTSDVKRSIWWKIYFFILTILSAFGLISFLADPGAGLSEYISVVLWLAATTGLFGFVFIKPIYKPKFWLQVLIAYCLFNVLYYFITGVDLRMGMSETEYYISNVIGWVISLPAFYGLYAYSKPSYPAWKNA